ncbi:FLYWCH-type zinc finger-containing protein 1-like [Rhopalosiphum padi]|uniref:FLYWCH-type zinc finger-containing protein 1-like n=1 Tax=Rhopalosiphum padi TaxID=40932 RepID=UPI00298E0F36|nr:FLYWCH-type zinc finger-containing protein 1-like [Rhopalosiphum padi]
MEFIKSNKYKLLLVYNSYTYRKEKMYKESKYWKCIDMQCKSRLTITIDNTIKKESSEHNHVPDICKLEVKKEVERMKSQALDNPQQIVASSQLNLVISEIADHYQRSISEMVNESTLQSILSTVDKYCIFYNIIGINNLNLKMHYLDLFNKAIIRVVNHPQFFA